MEVFSDLGIARGGKEDERELRGFVDKKGNFRRGTLVNADSQCRASRKRHVTRQPEVQGIAAMNLNIVAFSDGALVKIGKWRFLRNRRTSRPAARSSSSTMRLRVGHSELEGAGAGMDRGEERF